MLFGADNGNTNWKDDEILELTQIYNFGPFESLGLVNKSHIPPGHTKIQVHLIYDYKQDGRYKARTVASSNMTWPNIDTYYYIVISLRSMRTIVFLAELNNIETHTCDISNAYLTARTTENIIFNSGSKFAPFGHAGHLPLIKTTIYGLKSSGARFHSQLSDSLIALGFVPSMGGCDIWILNKGNYYPYVACYCYDLIVVQKDPGHIFESIIGKGFTINKTPALDYFLGVNFESVKYPKTNHEILTLVSKTYVNCMLDNFKNTFSF